MDHARLIPPASRRPLGRTGLVVTPIGFGAFKIGRNTATKYATPYDLPSDEAADRILHAVVDQLGVNYVDTAPAYGLSEERVGRALGSSSDVVISTKVGEAFDDGVSRFDFSHRAVRDSLARSRARLKREALDLVFVHSDGSDMQVLNSTDVVAALAAAKASGEVRFIGFSGKTIEGARAALDWADAIMVEYHLDDQSHAGVMQEAAQRGVGVIVKKGLASGRLSAPQAVRFVLANPHVASMVVGGLNLDHLRDNLRAIK